MNNDAAVKKHRAITDAVHAEDGKIAIQLLHTGRYAYHPFSVSASAVKAPINPFKPKEMSTKMIEQQIDSFADAAQAIAGRRLRRRRDHGQRGLPDQPVPRAAHQQAHRRLGRHAGEPPPLPARDRAPLPRGRRRRLHHRLPDLDPRPRRRRPDLGRDRRARGARSKQPARRSSTAASAGTSRKVPTIATSVPREAFTWITPPPEGSRDRPGRRQQPHQHARVRRGSARRAATPT